MVRELLLIGAFAAAVAAGPASAADGQAQLTSVSGKVLVNQGTGFVPPSSGMMLGTGQKIFVGHEASAVITYKADNCQVKLPENRVATIEALSPCQNKTVQIQPAADMPQAYVPPPVNYLPLVALAAIPIIFCIIECGHDDNDHGTRENNNND